MRLSDYKTIFVIVGLSGILLISSLTFTSFLSLPMGQPFSEIYLLGSNHLFEDYPSNVTLGQSYQFYVDVGNHMTSSNYYLAHVKFTNDTTFLPDLVAGTPSPLPSLYEYRFLLPQNVTSEKTLNFSVSEGSISGNNSIINAISINGAGFNVNLPNEWDMQKEGFYYRLIVELWIYDTQSNSFVYNNRFVDLQLNFTEIQ
jgi:uncharacterized membrane protein